LATFAAQIFTLMIQKTILAISLAFVFASCADSGSENIDTNVVNNPLTASEGAGENVKLPVMTFDEVLYDFGTITEGESVHVTFEFTNTGEADLVISSANSSCGCTVPDWPKKPIQPGEKGKIKVVFNSAGKGGPIHKQVNISANTQPEQNQVAIKGEVLKSKTEE
jgi:hypothetical protein